MTVDVVIVGAGSSGSVLASRLSEDPSRSVLLLEDGPDHGERRPERVRDAATVPSASTDHDWTRWTEARLTPLVSRQVPSGRLVGGSSAVNGTYFVRGTREDFDGWAERGNPQWSYDAVLPAFRRAERDLDLGAGTFHGGDGPLPVRRATDDELAEVSAAFVAAALDAGFPAEPDKNAPGPPGVGPVPCTAVDGTRVDVASAYLAPARARPNLAVRGGARVLRVLIRGGRAVGVELAGPHGPEVVRAERVVLSAGALGSPQLLLRSGVGPAAQLRGLGIAVALDSPGVGRLWDHPAIDVQYRPARTTAFPARGPGFQVALHAGRDVEILATTRPYGVANGEAPHDDSLSLRVGIQCTEVPGRLSLRSPAPDVSPLVEHRYLATDVDRARVRRALRLAAELLSSESMGPLVERSDGPADAELASDAQLDRWAATRIGTAVHASGTCAMGPDGDHLAVVDQRCRVRGVDGLWVVDASVMPTITSRGTAATAVMIGERAAELFG